MLYTVSNGRKEVTIQLVAEHTPEMLKRLISEENDRVNTQLSYSFSNLRENLIVPVTFHKSNGTRFVNIEADEPFRLFSEMCVQLSAKYHDDPYSDVTLAVEVK